MEKHKWVDYFGADRHVWYACLDMKTHRMIFIAYWNGEKVTNVALLARRKENRTNSDRGKIVLEGCK